MGQKVSTEQGHEWLGKRSKSFVKGPQGRLTGYCIADQDGDKIDEVVLTKARSGEPHLVLDLFQDPRMGKYLSKGCHFSHPGRSRRRRFWSNLDRDKRMRHTGCVFSLSGNRWVYFLPKETHFFGPSLVSLLLLS